MTTIRRRIESCGWKDVYFFSLLGWWTSIRFGLAVCFLWVEKWRVLIAGLGCWLVKDCDTVLDQKKVENMIFSFSNEVFVYWWLSKIRCPRISLPGCKRFFFWPVLFSEKRMQLSLECSHLLAKKHWSKILHRSDLFSEGFFLHNLSRKHPAMSCKVNFTLNPCTKIHPTECKIDTENHLKKHVSKDSRHHFWHSLLHGCKFVKLDWSPTEGDPPNVSLHPNKFVLSTYFLSIWNVRGFWSTKRGNP